MAGPSELTEVVSEATGVPLATVVDIDRRLVKAKLRTKGGRGLNAARMTPLDAARLLTAVLGSSQAYVSVDAVERYSQTRVDKARSSNTLFEAAKIDDLATLPSRHGFVDALEALISSASNGSLAKMIAEADSGSIPCIEVYAFTRATRGRIRLSGLPGGITASVEYVPASDGAKSGRPKKSGRGRATAADNNVGDLEQSRRITEQTVLPVAQLFA
jgi:hypothetical protein